MTPIGDAVNIGPTLAAELTAVGVDSVERLRELGALPSWELLGGAGMRDCANSLLALEGAVRGVRWTSIPQAERRRLTERAGLG
jgi:DNA transformation protein